jgi:hypothetical protein
MAPLSDDVERARDTAAQAWPSGPEQDAEALLDQAALMAALQAARVGGAIARSRDDRLSSQRRQPDQCGALAGDR